MNATRHAPRCYHASILSPTELRALDRGLGRGYPNPGRITREELDAEKSFRERWPTRPPGAGWTAASTPPPDGVPVLGYRGGVYSASVGFCPGEFRVVTYDSARGEYWSAAEDTPAPAYWRGLDFA